MKYMKMKNIASSLVVLGTLSLAHPLWAENAESGQYRIDPAHTNIQFAVNHLGFSNLIGRFNTFEGDIEFNPKGTSKVELTIETNSLDTNHGKRDDHLRSPDFFNVKQYPKMHFVSKKVEYNDQGEPTTVNGTLSLHGKKNPATLSVEFIGAGKDPWGGYRAGYKASTIIKRSDYGMEFMQGGIGDDVEITLNVEAIKK